VTQILCALEQGNSHAAEQLLPLVYDELRKLATLRLSHEQAGQTLQPTALVHEAYLRLVGAPDDQHYQWNGRGHFFAAAAEAMRRILIDNARRKRSIRHGGQLKRVDLGEVAQLEEASCAAAADDDQLLELDAALERLVQQDEQSAQLVKLRYFAGLTIPQAAEAMGISPRKADLLWSFARAWLRREMQEE
jgi:RNA polymerase sigma factor (TIGR02999 family)